MAHWTADAAYSLTLKAYGRREEIVHMGNGHRHAEVVDQAKHDGEFLLSTLDEMQSQEADDSTDLAKRSRLDAVAVDRIAEALCKAVVGAKDLRSGEYLAEPLPVDERARLVAVYAMRDLLGF